MFRLGLSLLFFLGGVSVVLLVGLVGNPEEDEVVVRHLGVGVCHECRVVINFGNVNVRFVEHDVAFVERCLRPRNVLAVRLARGRLIAPALELLTLGSVEVPSGALVGVLAGTLGVGRVLSGGLSGA